jgi:ribonucleoside-diphosphate reductase alpha chain
MVGRYINQGGKRAGSIAIYIEPWHADIFSFIELRKNTGDENLRARDLFLAVWAPDIFMRRVQEDAEWSLMCPDECPGLVDSYGDDFEKLYIQYENEGRMKKKVKAADLWNHILESQVETGMPYLSFKDTVNKRNMQSQLGVIRNSNLCVAPETMILTRKGYQRIKELADQSVELWNGEEWSLSEVKKTGENKKLVRVTLSNGSYLDCTPEHNFPVMYNPPPSTHSMVSASELKEGDRLLKYKLPSEAIEGDSKFDMPCPIPECQENGTANFHYRYPFILGEQLPLLASKECRLEWVRKIYNVYGHRSGKVYIRLYKGDASDQKYDFDEKNANEDKIFDYDFHEKHDLLSFKRHSKFLNSVRLLLQTFGVDSKIKLQKNSHNLHDDYSSLVLSSKDSSKLFSNILDYPSLEGVKEDPTYVKVESVKDLGRISDTYCFTEPKRHLGMFNGILAGNCNEISLVSNSSNYSVCNLSSICLPKFVENGVFNFEKLQQVAGIATYNLNNVIDVNYYPTPECRKTNMENRPIGIGIQGLADVFFMLGMSFDSKEARELNKKILENIYYASVKMSISLAKKYGTYTSFPDSHHSKGLLQFHLFDKQPELSLDWTEVLEDLKMYGMRNSLLTALMPTASTSQICGNTEAFEPITSNLYLRKTMSGEFTVVNSYLIKDLIRLGLWSKEVYEELLHDNGSVQRIQCIPRKIKEIYKTAFELKMTDILKPAIDRSPFVDHQQSMNLFMKDINLSTLNSSHFYSWKGGLKTGMYYLRSCPTVDATKFGLDPLSIQRIKKERKDLKEEVNKKFSESGVCPRDSYLRELCDSCSS